MRRAATTAFAVLSTFLVLAPVLAADPVACPTTGVRIYLTAQGVVTLNGQKVNASKLKDMLGSLKPKPTLVCYSRDNPGGEPHPVVEVVMNAIASARLPVGMFTDSTFRTQVKLP
jgi:hypothetical protein